MKRLLLFLSQNRVMLHLYRWLLGWIPMAWLPLRRGRFEIRVHSVDRWIAAWRFDPEEVRREYGAAVVAGDCVADLGANVGLHTMVLADMVGPTGRVVAFEPHPANFRSLTANVAANGLDRVLCVNQAVSDTGGTRPMYVSMGNNGDHRLAPHPAAIESVPVSCCRLDDRQERFCCLKLDVQGHELAALRGARAKLADPVCRAVFLEILPVGLEAEGACEADIEALLAEHGFHRLATDEVDRTAPYYDVVFLRPDRQRADR